MKGIYWMAAGLALGWAFPSWAEVAVPVADVLPQIQAATDLPILLPDSVPLGRVYLDVEAERDRYYVGFDLHPDCHSATACHFGEIMAFSDDGSNPENAETIALVNDTPAAYFSSCGAHCTASVQWLYRGIVYRVMVKNGTKEETVALANSAIAAGDRRSVSQQVEAEESPYIERARLRAQDPSSPINIRSGASTDSEVRHLGYSGDAIEILDDFTDGYGYRWFYIRFPQSGATGWVRGDFVAR
jgi:hypothetical protein